jgi:hypothetical protein
MSSGKKGEGLEQNLSKEQASRNLDSLRIHPSPSRCAIGYWAQIVVVTWSLTQWNPEALHFDGTQPPSAALPGGNNVLQHPECGE